MVPPRFPVCSRTVHVWRSRGPGPMSRRKLSSCGSWNASALVQVRLSRPGLDVSSITTDEEIDRLCTVVGRLVR